MGKRIPCNLISKPLGFPQFPINITPPPRCGQDQDVGKIRKMWPQGHEEFLCDDDWCFKEYKICLNFSLRSLLKPAASGWCSDPSQLEINLTLWLPLSRVSFVLSGGGRPHTLTLRNISKVQDNHKIKPN
jgi:hypothetical protein